MKIEKELECITKMIFTPLILCLIGIAIFPNPVCYVFLGLAAISVGISVCYFIEKHKEEVKK